jgi:mRNA interferase MazF
VGHPSTFVLPCTTRLTGESLLRVELPKGLAGNTRDCEIMIDQGRAIDNARLRRRLGKLPRRVLAEVKGKIGRLLDL